MPVISSAINDSPIIGDDEEFISLLNSQLNTVEIYNYVFQPCFALIFLIHLPLSLSLSSFLFLFVSPSSPLFIRTFPSNRPRSFSIQIHFRQSYRRPLPRTILYGCYLRLLLLRGDGYRYCMAAAHRETILTAKKVGGTLRYESCNPSHFFSRSNLQFDQITL